MTFLWLLVRALRDASEAAAAALAVLPRASAKSPIDLDGGDGNERAAKKPYDILHEASYAIDAPAGDNRRVLAHNIAMHNEELAQQAAALELTRTLRNSAAEQERLELARTLRESAMKQDRFECAEALVLAQATRESEAECPVRVRHFSRVRRGPQRRDGPR